LPLLSGSLALAEDFKLINGRVYKNATISRVEADGIVVKTKTGISKIYFVELPKDVQDRFHYVAVTPITALREREPIKVEAKQHASPQARRARLGRGSSSFDSFFKTVNSGRSYRYRRTVVYRS
jgi:hypothetical protein